MVRAGGGSGRRRAARLNEIEGGGSRVARAGVPARARLLTMGRLPPRGLASAVGNVTSVAGAAVEGLLRLGGGNIVDFASGCGLASERVPVSIVVGDVDAVGRLALELMSDGLDKPIDALPTLWESDFDHSLGGGPGLVVKVEGDLLSKNVTGITKLLSRGLVNRVGVHAVMAVASVNIESTERRSDSGAE